MIHLEQHWGMTQDDRFKHDRSDVDKMLKATLYIQRSNAPSVDSDDIIRLYEDDDIREMVRIVYSTPELRKGTAMYVPAPRAMAYISDLLKTLRHDSQPFEYVQVTTAIHPSILYHVSDMDNYEVRHLIEDTVEVALRQSVFRTKKV